MNRFKAIGSAFLFVPALALISTQARAEFKCDAPSTHIDRAACEKAAQSPSALRQYIQRMRGIDSLQFADYVDEAQARAWAQDESNRAPTKKAPVRTAVLLQENPGA
ncbi:MAG: hypothetical protein H0V63_02615 [Burkholderiaceae bacterium]|nr:hypothetical protein [Burkholderiaceae bacterium]